MDIDGWIELSAYGLVTNKATLPNLLVTNRNLVVLSVVTGTSFKVIGEDMIYKP
jgi:hypothetical protein